ncbi:GAD-like domain-containing protein [Morganella morganii]|uniref:GAD-like domain-containing protein n=1 Tax=Morganella morganii TaxID=582 RepID=UPI0021CFBC33|nr:GAD-like domain-containing protein [Morganella morganii]MCU6223660.1 GAD-like domain protein [Morganella morganii]MCU6233999.1 GAD-like domain protein [Morganella morganii]
MRDHYFDSLIKEFGEATTSRYVSQDAIQKWGRTLPEKLLSYWNDEGWSSYNNGLFSLVDPSLYHDAVLEWLDETYLISMDNFHVIASTGFGDFYLFGERYGLICKILSRSGVIEVFSNSIKLTEKLLNSHVESLIQSITKENIDKSSVFDKLINRFGTLGENEIFCFEPMVNKINNSKFLSARKINAVDYLIELRRVVKPVILHV